MANIFTSLFHARKEGGIVDASLATVRRRLLHDGKEDYYTRTYPPKYNSLSER